MPPASAPSSTQKEDPASTRTQKKQFLAVTEVALCVTRPQAAALHSIGVRKVVKESIEFYYSLISQDSMLCMLE